MDKRTHPSAILNRPSAIFKAFNHLCSVFANVFAYGLI